MKITIVFLSLNRSPNGTLNPFCATTVSAAARCSWSFVSPACSSNVAIDASSTMPRPRQRLPRLTVVRALVVVSGSDKPRLLRERCLGAVARGGCVNVVEGVLGRGAGVDSMEAAYGGDAMALSSLIAAAFERSRSGP